MKNDMFRGTKSVFGFTYTQNVKNKSYKASLIGIGIFLFALMIAINIIAGFVTADKKKSKGKSEKKFVVDTLYYVKDENVELTKFAEYSDYEIKEWKEISSKEEINSLIGEMDQKDYGEESGPRAIALAVSYNEPENEYEIYVNYSAECSEKNVSKVMEEFESFYKEELVNSLGIDAEILQVVQGKHEVQAVDIREADKSLAVILASVFIPMIVVFFMYMMILLYGQTVGKIIIVEKSSKLMETLLISIKPYGIIAGKLLAVYASALIQVIVWIAASIAGFFVGNKIADSVFENYKNPVMDLIRLMRQDAEGAFSIGGAAMAVIAIAIGFFMYMVLAALTSSFVTKTEELSNTASVFQIVVIIGFLVSYMIPLMREGGIITKLIEYVPITAPFTLPADVLLGKIGMIGSLASILIMIATSVILILITGKLYKKKLF